MISLARMLIILGLILVVVGGLIFLLVRVGLPIGRLPGDIRIQTENLTCFFLLATMIILSVLLTIILNVIARFLNR
jgi:hypothetical protein